MLSAAVLQSMARNETRAEPHVPQVFDEHKLVCPSVHGAGSLTMRTKSASSLAPSGAISMYCCFGGACEEGAAASRTSAQDGSGSERRLQQLWGGGRCVHAC